MFDTTGSLYRFTNNPYHINSAGFETQIKYTIGKFTLFVGYTYTDASYDVNGKDLLLPLVPKHSIKGDLLFVEEGKWRIGWDYEYKSSQRLSNNRFTRELFSTGVVIERTLGNFVLFFNAENITDVRQTKYEHIRSAPYNTSQFTEIWGAFGWKVFELRIKTNTVAKINQAIKSRGNILQPVSVIVVFHNYIGHKPTPIRLH